MFQPRSMSRRDMLKGAGCGFGYLALAGLCGELFPAAHSAAAMAVSQAYQSPLLARAAQFPAKAKRVIFLFMQGGPSHIDTFDYKPRMQRAGSHGARGNILPSPFKFNQYGKSGLWISELFPHLGQHADDLCILNGMHSDNPAHPQATIALHTGSSTFVRPSVGSWVLYGLGTENQNLPGFITINPVSGLGGAQNYGSAFLPATFQGTKVDDAGIPDLKNRMATTAQQRKQLDLVQSLNHDYAGRTGPNEQIDGLIESFELGFRMQGTVPDVMDISNETRETLELYGITGAGSMGGTGGKRRGEGANSFGRQCLMARRFAEAGVRFIEVTYPGWDQHRQLKEKLTENANGTDKAIAGLITDLKRRGMFDETLIVWGGEFGRTPTSQGDDGRNHNNRGYSMWLAGGGVQGGITYGHTDDIGGEAVEGKVHTHDLHATILALLGLNHEKLTYRYAGRDFRLTDVYGNVVKQIIA
jgi:hypothetical protein